MLVLSGLFLFSLFATLLAGTAAPVYVQWTGGLPLWPIVLPFAVMGGTAAWLIRRYVKRFWGDKCSAILAVLSAMVAFSLLFYYLCRRLCVGCPMPVNDNINKTE